MQIVAAVLVSYLVFLLVMLVGWRRAAGRRAPAGAGGNRITVIIAMRNEAHSIGKILARLVAQDYPNFEVIVVDDHSTDGSAMVVEKFIDGALQKNISLVGNPGEGKKQALTFGATRATGTVLVTTDADCEVLPTWLAVIDRYFSDPDTVMCFGPVNINPGKDFFSRVQSVEFLSVFASSVSTWGLGWPVMCNGANLAIRKEAFDAVGGYVGSLHVPSGDDEFLMRKVLARWPRGFKFIFDPAARVTTDPCLSLRDFFYQRIRWAGKWRHNSSAFAVVLALYIFVVQASFVLSVFLLFQGNGVEILALLLTSRALLEGLLIRNAGNLVRTRWQWLPFLLLQVVYPIYVIVIGLTAHFFPYTWKGRRHFTSGK